MTEMRWFRLYTDAVDNAKLKLLAFEDRWHYIAFCCLKRSGMLDKDTPNLERMIAVKLGVQLRELDEIKRRLMDVELIEDDYSPRNWNERQYISDSSTDRVRKHRKNKQKVKVKRSCNVSVTPPESESDTESDKSKVATRPFDRFWQTYPKKVKKKTARDIWKRKKLDGKAETICADIEKRLTADARWLDGYIPDPTTYLNGERWEDELSQPRQSTDPYFAEIRRATQNANDT